MPEISEIARIVHFLRLHLKNRRIASVVAEDDPIVYGKVGTSAAAFQTALAGRTVLDARQQGKYFWLVMDKPPHPLMHFGMTGWINMRDVETGYYKPKKEDTKQKKLVLQNGNVPEAIDAPAGSTIKEDEGWPPRFSKFTFKMEGEPRCEIAFVDARRLGRIRLVDVPADKMRQTTPLKENGPDPVIDKDILTEQWLTAKLRSKKSPVKAVLLDQANISGVGNWVGDEVLYNAKIHPEQYSNTLTDQQCKQLHKSLVYVCTTACNVLGDSDKYPEDWLFKHRWSKGKNAVNILPNGEKIVHLTVGGRTSAVVPSVQKKTGPVAGDVDDDVKEEEAETKNEKKSNGGASKGKKTQATANSGSPRKRKSEPADEPKAASAKKTKTKPKAEPDEANDATVGTGRRKSSRLGKA